MAVFNVVDGNLVSNQEFAEKGVGRALAAQASGASPEKISLASGSVIDFQRTGFAAPFAAAPAPTPFPPIKYGEPLTIDIRHVYTGRVGAKSLFDGTGDVAVVSGVKDWSEIKASARALNFVAPKTGKHAHLGGPGALTDGTRVVAYQKAVATRQVVVSLEIAAADPEDGLASKLGKAFTAAAGIPLFMPYAGVLLAAGQLIPLAGKLANALGGGKSPWHWDAEINFGYPGTPDSVAELKIVGSDSLQQYKYGLDGKLYAAGGQAYEGDEPYMAIAVYGGINTELENFTPAVASADLINRFYNAQQGAAGALDDLIEVMQLASDFKFRKAAEALKKRVDAAAPGSDEAKALKAQLDAALKNISNPQLKP